MPSSPKLRMQAVMAALAKGDGAPFAAILSEDFTWVSKGSDGLRLSGKDAVRERLFDPLFASLEGLDSDAIDVGVEDIAVVVTCRGDIVARRGVPYRNTWRYVCTFGEDGLLHEVVESVQNELVDVEGG